MKTADHFQVDDRVMAGMFPGIVVKLDRRMNEVLVIHEDGEKLWYVADALSLITEDK